MVNILKSTRFLRAFAWTGAGLYLAASAYLIARPDNHTALKLLAVQYLVLLPAVGCYLWANRSAEAPAARPRVRFMRPGVLYLVYALLMLPLGMGVQRDLALGDESSYRFQSRIFRAGRLAAEAPPQTYLDHAAYARQFRFHHHVIHDGKWFSKYFPGWPALLALGTAAVPAWLVNPALGLFILWVTGRLARRLFDDEVARCACFFLVASPYFLLNCMGFMSHPACSAFLVAAALFFFRGYESGRLRDFAVMSLFVGLAALVRPVTAAFAALPLAFGTLWRLRRAPARLAAVTGLGALAVTLSVAVLLSYNHALTGSYSRSTYAVYSGSTQAPELFLAGLRHLQRFLLTDYRRALQQTVIYAFVFVFILAAYVMIRERRRSVLWPLAALFGGLLVGRIFPPAPSGHPYGDRLLFETFFAVAILGAVGWTRLRDDLQLSTRTVRNLAVLLLAAQALLFAYFVRMAYGDLSPYAKVRACINDLNLDRAVAFMESGPGFSPRDFNQNGPAWRQTPVFYTVDPGSELRPVVARALARRQWVVVAYDPDSKAARVTERGELNAPR